MTDEKSTAPAVNHKTFLGDQFDPIGKGPPRQPVAFSEL
jgi:hypothetical protein